MTTFQRVTFASIWPEVEPLAAAHVLETQGMAARINAMTYLALDDAGSLRVYVARSGGVLVGYCTMCVVHDPHRADRILASQDGIYFDKAYRGWTPIHFLRWVDEQLAAEGVHKVIRHARQDTMVMRDGEWKNPAALLYERAGYAPDEIAFARDLQKVSD